MADTVASNRQSLSGWQERAGLIGASAAFAAIVAQIPLFASSDATVLIEGESGTGKELFARAIHALSGRRGALVPINCGAIPTDLFERELFGHRRSAFTGATTSEAGLLQAAEGGTLFFDDIDCLPLHAQAKVLRLLQEREYRALGSTALVRADVRFVAASNTSLAERVRAGEFRLDLHYRLLVLPLPLPPLRARRDDIPVLAQHFLDAKGAGKRFSAESLAALLNHDWPGNVRELQHVVERAHVLSRGQETVSITDLQIAPAVTREPESFREAKRRVVDEFERAYLKEILALHGGNIASASRAAKKNRRAFWELLRKHRIVQRSAEPTTLAIPRCASGPEAPSLSASVSRDTGV